MRWIAGGWEVVDEWRSEVETDGGREEVRKWSNDGKWSNKFERMEYL